MSYPLCQLSIRAGLQYCPSQNGQEEAMSLSLNQIETTLKEMGLHIEAEGRSLVHATKGRHAPVINSVVTIDEDGEAATILSALGEKIAPEKRADVCELLNLVHGQSLWNVRFHLDETGQVFSVGKVMAWGKPFNPIQLGDIFFSLLVTTDRLHPCIIAVNEEGKSASDAFELFFLSSPEEGDNNPQSER